jgi:hypothetical protein
LVPWLRAELPLPPAVPLRSAVSGLRRVPAEVARDRVPPVLQRRGEEAAGLPEVASCRRHRHHRPGHPETVGRNSQTRHREMGSLAALPQTLREWDRLLTEDCRQSATARAIIRTRMGTDYQTHPQSRRRCHLLAATILLGPASRGSDLRAVSHRLPYRSLQSPQFDQVPMVT